MSTTEKVKDDVNQIIVRIGSFSIFFLAILGLTGNYPLFADGSYMILSMVKNHNYFLMPIEWNRALSYVLTQFPVVALSNFKFVNIHIIVILYSIFTILIPALILIHANKILIREFKSFWIYLFTVPAFGGALLICVSTSIFGGVVLYYLVVKIIISRRHADPNLKFLYSLLPISSLLGDSFVLFIPAFCFLILEDFRSNSNVGFLHKSKLALPVALSLAVNGINFIQRMEATNLGSASNNALNFKSIVANKPFSLLMLSSAFIMLSLTIKNKFQNTLIVFAIMSSLMAINLPTATGYQIFMSRYVLPLTLGTIILILLKSNLVAYKITRKHLFAILIICLCSMIVQIKIFLPFRNFISTFSTESNNCSVSKKFNEIGLSNDARKFVWSYTNPSTSRLLWRNEKSCMIENDTTNTWEPFSTIEGDPIGQPKYWN